MQPFTSTAAADGGFPVGPDLVEWIERSEDFPLDKAHEINGYRWSRSQGGRFRKFTSAPNLGWAEFFLHNPWQKVEGPLLDIGCAGGHSLEYCAAQGIRPLFGVDIGAAYVRKARARVPCALIRHADFLELPYESDSFNAIFVRGSLHLTTTKGFLTALRESYRVLNAGGLIYIHRRFRPTVSEQRRARRFNLFTYLIYREPLSTDPNQKLWLIRNFVPEPQLTSMIRSVGFLPLGVPPATIYTTVDGKGNERHSVAYICTKVPSSRD
jgi:SAM-dependent methyltransferase